MSLFPQARGIPKRFIQGTPFNRDVDQQHDFTVPDGKLWLIVAFGGNNGDASNTTVFLYNSDNKALGKLSYWGNISGAWTGPERTADYPSFPLLAWETDQVRFVFAAAQTTGGTHVWLDVVEYDLKELLKKK